MTTEELKAIALELPDAIEDHPFGDKPDVYKVANRIFALVSTNVVPPQVSLKCEPGLAEAVRRQYPAVRPGYHLNKKHWNTVDLDGSIPDDEIKEMIWHSYEQVLAKLPKDLRAELRRELEILEELQQSQNS